MWRRLYVAFPRPEQARRAVAELERAGVARTRIHTVAAPGVDTGGLPVDVPRGRLREVEGLLERHPEAGIGGVGWTIAAAPL